MIDDSRTNPPIPAWNKLREEDRIELVNQWEFYSCPHGCGGDALDFYNAIRKILQQRERRYFDATMAGPLDTDHRAGGDRKC